MSEARTPLRQAAQYLVDDWDGTYEPDVRHKFAYANVDRLRSALRGAGDTPAPPRWPSPGDEEAVTAMAEALYETDPPELWMRTGADEYRRHARSLLAALRGNTPAPADDECGYECPFIESAHPDMARHDWVPRRNTPAQLQNDPANVTPKEPGYTDASRGNTPAQEPLLAVLDAVIPRCGPMGEPDGTYLRRCLVCRGTSAIVTEGDPEVRHRPECALWAALSGVPEDD